MALAPVVNSSNYSDLGNMWQQFIMRVYAWAELRWPLWPSAYVMRKYVFFLLQMESTCLSGAASACLPAFKYLAALVCWIAIYPPSNLADDFSLQILLFFPVNKLHSFFLCKSYSKTLTLTLFSFLASSDKLCPLEQPSSLFHLFFGRDLSEATLLNPLASITSHLCEHWSAWGAVSIRSARSQVGWGKVFH